MSRVHLPPWTCQILTTCRPFPSENDQKTRETTKDKRITSKQVGEAETLSQKNPTLGGVTDSREGSHQTGAPPRGQEVVPQHLASQPLGTALERCTPKHLA